MEIYTTTEGKEITLLPVSYMRLQSITSQVERQFRERGEQVDLPCYTAQIVGGGEVEHEHDEESIKTASPEEKAAWDAYHDCQARMGKEAIDRRNHYLFQKGIAIDMKDALEGDWIKEAEYFGFDPPSEDPKERVMEYIESELLKTPEDQVEVTTRIVRLSMAGVPQDALDAATDMFRSLLEGGVPSQEPEMDLDETEGVLESGPDIPDS